MIVTMVLLQVVGIAPDSLLSRANTRLSVVEPARPVAATRWRIDQAIANDPTSKDRAIADDGSKCSVVGAKVCTRPPRTLLRAEILND